MHRYFAGNKENTKFVYDGLDVVMDDDANSGVTKYQNGLGIDDKLSLKTNGVTKYFLTDHLGSTVALTNSSGVATEQTSYDSFGNATTNLSTRYQYTGREYDSFSGFHYYRARWYDANLGRFVSEDPIGFGGGDVNLYGYVWNDPLRFTDPMGLDGWGNDFANWADARTEFPRRSWQRDPQYWIWNGSANTAADLAFGFNNMFRVGTGLGQAMYCENLSDLDRLDLVSADVVRAGSLFLTMAGPFAGRFAGNPPTEPTVPVSRRFNPFEGKTPPEIDAMFRAKGYRPKGPDPMNGQGNYVSPKGRGYHLDANHPPGKPPHVGVHRPRGYRGRLDTRDFPL